MNVSIVVPTFNEGPNVPELIHRINAALSGRAETFEVIFVDDSTDHTPQIIEEAALGSQIPVRLLHRPEPIGGLGGAVLEGIALATYDWCLVMDGDLQHPPEVIPRLLERAAVGDAELVIASRYAAGGSPHGLAGKLRTSVSRLSTLVTKAMFPRRLHGCSDPMTGFFLLDRRTVAPAELQPRGFKILLEILARRQHRFVEIPFDFAPRYAGRSKASLRQGLRFLAQLSMLRFGRMSAFALVGGFGAVLNLLIMAGLVAIDVNYLIAAIIASELTIISNFLILDYVVFADLRRAAGPMWLRFAKSFTFNNVEAALRMPILWWLVSQVHISSVIAAGLTLVLAFVARFVYHALVVYAPARGQQPDTEASAPGARPSRRL